MRIIKLVLAAVIAIQTGCAAGARVGGPRNGVGAAIEVPPPPPIETRYPVPPPPQFPQ
jgi:hypothetical protein